MLHISLYFGGKMIFLLFDLHMTNDLWPYFHCNQKVKGQTHYFFPPKIFYIFAVSEDTKRVDL